MVATGQSGEKSHAALMDGNYRYQRHIYDLTRKYYLLGRDRLINDLGAKPGQTILELGCGTGRNLRLTAQRYPRCQLYGLDISEQMLETARVKFKRDDVTLRILLKQGDAAQFVAADFDRDGFDHIFISYALSMIPDWQGTLRSAVDALAPGGTVHVVDFGNSSGLPRFIRRGLHRWLARYHVTPRDSLREVAESICQRKGISLRYDSAFRDYAQFLTLTKTR